MKKLTSVVLSILMVISMLSCLFVGSVSAEEANNSVTAAEIYDISGKKIDNEQTYTNVTTAVNGEEVTATVEYDKDSGAYFFLGWYDETGAKVSADEAYTFTPAEGKIYTPRIGSANLIGGSGSFENYENSESLAVALPTGISSVNDITADNIPNFSGDNKWATNENAGYLGSTWPETIYDKDYNSYQQVATYRTIRLLNTFNVVEDATIAKSGSKYLHINGGGASSLGLENLNKNTDYKLSFYLRYSGVNANKIKSVGVTTTVNINNDQWNKDATLNSQGMLITLENAVPSHKIAVPSHKITVAKCDSTELSKVSTTEWQKITVYFNSGNLEKLYLAIVSTNGAALNYYIDDMVLVKAGTANSVSADVEFQNANGGAVDSSNEYAKADIIGNFDGTYTAKVAYDKDNGAYAFKGWYYDGELANVGEVFDINAETYPDVSLFKAVITSANLLPEAASFESYKSQTTLTYADSEKVDGVFPAPTSTKWGTSYEGTYFKDNYFKIHTVYGEYSVQCYDAESDSYIYKQFTAHNGNAMLRINTQSRSAIRALENLTPNTDYQLTFYVMGTSSLDYLNVVAVADCYNGYNLSTATESTEGTIAIKKLTYTEGWQKVQLSFNSGEHTTLYLHLRQQNKTSIDSQGGSFVDDLVCYEVEHNFGEYVSDGNATCTEDGTKTATCTISGCGATDTVTDEGSKLGHSFTNYVSDGNATCTEDGTKTAVCDRDGCDVTDIITDKGSAGHIFTNYVSDGNATCTEDGTKTAVCDREDCTETKTVTDEGSKLGHSFTKYVSDGNATCTEDGTKTAVCDREDCNVTNTIADEGSKLGHSFTKYVSDKNATCTADGTKTAVCDRDGCNVTNTVKDVGTKLAHKYTNSCDATCNVCGATRTVGAHKYSNNCDTTCNICGAVRKITHSYKTTTTKATLTKNGSIVKKCSVCGKVASTTTIYYPKTVKIAATTYTYTGKVITPAVTVKNSKGTALKKGTDYTVTYASGRKNVGKYKVTVTFKGNYSGTKTFYFTINPVKTTVRKLTAGKKSIKVNITKKSTQVTGYQIQYSTSKTFKSAKTKTISSYKTTSTTLTKLTSKKTYYVRVRTYKTVGKTKYYSAWSTYKYTKAK